MQDWKGLTSAEVMASQREHGDNRLPAFHRNGFWRSFIANFGDPVIKVLLVVLAINLIFMLHRFDWYETVGIGAAVLLATLVSTISEYGSESAFAKLQEEAEAVSCRTKRNGSVQLVPLDELVVGDIVLLQSGERVPADGVLVQGGVRVDRSAINGESAEVKMREGEALLRGYVICGGEGVMRITAVGSATQYGHLAREVQESTRESPMKVRLGQLAQKLSRLGMAAAALVAVADLFHTFILNNHFDRTAILADITSPAVLLEAVIHALTLAVTVIVVAVPEGLPMMITVVLSSNMRRMLHDRVLVRKPVGIETAGSMTVLFTDKTGTLTSGRLTVTGVLTGDGRERTAAMLRSSRLWETVESACTVNTECLLSGGRPIGGNATDRAVFSFCLPLRSVRRADSRIPFDSTRKFSAACLDGVTYVKGAPERLLAACTAWMRPDGEIVPLNAHDITNIKERVRSAAMGGKRVLAMAVTRTQVTADGPLPALTLLGCCVIADALRREAPAAVKQLQGAGITVVMLTGDGRETATAIAKQAGILCDADEKAVLSGAELAALSDAQVCARLSRLRVLYRAQPSDKSRLVRLAQQCGMVVGMTGDGVNDAPALKKCDVGFAMGSGTEVAKEAGDIVILDDNIASIAKAVLYGRTVFNSIRKFLVFQLTMNLCAVGISVIGPFIGVNTPVTVIQMLWVNIIMDTLAGLAFAGEPPLEAYMCEAPKRRDEPVMTRYMAGQVGFTGLFTVLLCALFLKLPFITAWFRPSDDNIYHMTGFFALFIFCGVFNSFSVRTSGLNPLRHLRGNRRFALIMGAVTAVQLWMIYYGGSLFRTGGLTWRELRYTVGLALAVIPAGIVYKWLLRRHTGTARAYRTQKTAKKVLKK